MEAGRSAEDDDDDVQFICCKEAGELEEEEERRTKDKKDQSSDEGALSSMAQLAKMRLIARERQRNKQQRRAKRKEERKLCAYTVVENPLAQWISLERTPCSWVKTMPQLLRLTAKLNTTERFAFDFETTCRLQGHAKQPTPVLLQISIEYEDFLVDLLEPEVKKNIHYLRGPFDDECILKVVHGTTDEAFLRQMLGIRPLSRLRDTSLGGSRALDALVYEACGIWLDKSLSTSDWTLRPLTPEMVAYARSDTHYLLRCFDYLARNRKI